MKKLFVLLPIIFFISAGCNTTKQPASDSYSANPVNLKQNPAPEKNPTTSSNQYPVTPAATGFTILIPNKQDQQWILGTEHDIKWQNIGDTHTTNVRISLKSTQSGGCTNSLPPHCFEPPAYIIAESAPNSGSYHWLVPSNLDPVYTGDSAIIITTYQGATQQQTYSASVSIVKK